MSDNPKIRRRLRCPSCGSLDALKWGVRNGVQRYKCRNCQSLFSARRKEISKSNRFIWFKKWVLGKMTVEDIAEISGYSSRHCHLFEFIKHPGLPKTTNALESFFGHIKDQLRLHRGLSETRVDNFIKWYLYFNDEKKSKK